MTVFTFLISRPRDARSVARRKLTRPSLKLSTAEIRCCDVRADIRESEAFHLLVLGSCFRGVLLL
jgi:hypothetical protein